MAVRHSQHHRFSHAVAVLGNYLLPCGLNDFVSPMHRYARMLCATDRLEETWTTLLASTQYFELDDDDRILNFTSKQVQEKLHQLHIGTVYARFSAAVKLKAADAASVTSVAHPPA